MNVPAFDKLQTLNFPIGFLTLKNGLFLLTTWIFILKYSVFNRLKDSEFKLSIQFGWSLLSGNKIWNVKLQDSREFKTVSCKLFDISNEANKTSMLTGNVGWYSWQKIIFNRHNSFFEIKHYVYKLTHHLKLFSCWKGSLLKRFCNEYFSKKLSRNKFLRAEKIAKWKELTFANGLSSTF